MRSHRQFASSSNAPKAIRRLPHSKLAAALFVALTIFAAAGFSSQLGSETASASTIASPTATPPASPTATRTPRGGATATSTPTAAVFNQLAIPTSTRTAIPGTPTRTATAVQPTATRTPTPVPATATRTKTPVGATTTKTSTVTPTATSSVASNTASIGIQAAGSASVDEYSQCSNDQGTGYTSGDLGCRWTNGNLQGSNSRYFEGDSTVQRLGIKDLTTGDHTITFTYGTTKNGKHAYDYITDDKFSETWVTDADMCDPSLSQFASCSTAAVATSGLIPTDANAAGHDVANPNRHFRIRNGTWSNTGVVVTGIVSAPTLSSGTYAGSSETSIQLKFSVDAATCLNSYTVQGTAVCEVLITFGAHVSKSTDWAPELTAIDIAGSPYHVSLAELDSGTIGQRDNQMQASAIIQPGNIVIIKDAVPDDAQDFAFTTTGTGLSGFSLDDDNDATLPKTKTFSSLVPGSYSVTETATTGWDLTGLSCSTTIPTGDTTTTSLANRVATIDLDAGETVTCTYTNTKRGSIIVEKQTNPDGAPGSFTFTGTAAGSIGDGGQITVNNLVPGTYTSTEANPSPGYSLTSIVCDDATSATPSTFDLATRTATFKLDPGETVKCTFTNTQQTGTLRVIKTVVNDNGGTKVASDFNLHVKSGGTDVSGSPAAGSTTGTVYTLPVGSYAVSEDAPPAGYTNTTTDATNGDCDASGNVTVVAGQQKVCTITNNDAAPALHLRKVVTNDNGGTSLATDWTLTADGTGANDLTGTTPVDSGPGLKADTFTLSESGPSGYTASTWTCVLTGTTTPMTVTNAQVAVGLSQDVTCTINNNDKAPALTLDKVVVNDNGGTALPSAWTLSATGALANPTNLSGPGASGSTDVVSGATFKADTYTLAESGGPGGYSGSLWSCLLTGTTTAVTVTNAQVTVGLGQDVTCTITNNDNASALTLVKVVTNDNGGTKGVSDFPLFYGTTLATSGVSNGVSPGTFTLSETNQTGYTASLWSCVLTGTATPVTVTNAQVGVGLGQDVTCTITNNDNAPALTLDKVVINDNGGTALASAWTLSATGALANPTNLSGPGASGSTDVVSGTTFKADTYTLAESAGPGGYTASVWSCVKNAAAPVSGSSITLTVGDVAVCTITNNDQPAHLTLLKTVVDDNGGTAVDTDWTLKATGPTSISGIEGDAAVSNAAVSAGAYTLSEANGPAGYAASTWSCVKNNGTPVAANSITLALNDSATCTITNNDIAPTLKLVKTVVNNNGGTKVVSDFPLFINGNGVTSGVANTLSAGVLYTATETNLPGYTASAWGGDCAANGTITLHPGDAKTCTITNDDAGPTLTLVKTVINDNGGTKVVSDFPLFINGNAVTSGVANSLSANVLYTATETSSPGYTASVWGGDCTANGTITLQPGDAKTCTITNNDQPSFVIVNKIVINDDGGHLTTVDFPLFLDGNAVTSGVSTPVTPGLHTATETQQTGYTGPTFSGDCNASSNGSVTVALGETKTCNLINNDIAPTLKLVKTVVNNNGGTKVVSDFPLFINGNGVTSGVANTLSAGVLYTATETNLPGYTPSVWGGDCAANGTITLQPGDAKTCTITNDDVAPSLTLVKTVINNNGGTKIVSDFPLFINGNGVTSGIVNTLSAGVLYTATETNLPGYTPSAWGGDCAANGTITLQPGDAKTCTITNDDQPATLTLVKTVVNNNGGTAAANDFARFIDGNAVSWSVAVPVTPGSHTASETTLAGYTASAWGGDCAANGTVSIALGDNKTCTITNDDQPATLTLVKTVINNNGGTAVADDFARFIDGNAVSWSVAVPVNPGAHLVTETGLSSYAGSAWGGDCAANGTVSIALGENKTCSITNDDKPPELHLRKNVVNNNGGIATDANFTLTANGTGPNDLSGTSTVDSGTGLQADTWALSETSLPGYSASAWVCVGGSQNGSNITLGVGDSATCTITNTDTPATLTLVKTVVNNNGGTAVAADFARFIDGNPVSWSVAVPVTPGGHTASETTLAGYTASAWGGDCAANGTVTVALGESKTCSITNDDQPTTLTLVKTVVNNNGGTAVANDFARFIDGNAVSWSVAVPVTPGSHTASETTLAGYTASAWGGDCAANGTVTIALGDNKTCSITNDDQPATLTLVKTVVNNNGGTAVAADFARFIDGNAVSWSVAVPVTPGGHTASETTLAGYTASAWGGDCAANGTVTVALGESKTCSITNDDQPTTLTLVKTVVNNNGGTAVANDFARFIDGNAVSWSVAVPVTPGSHTASETTLAGYTASAWGGDCAANGTVTIALGDNKTCSITNDDQPATLTLVKTVVNNNGGTAVAADFARFIDGNAVSWSVAVPVTPGGHTASETTLAGYTASAWGGDCAANGTVTIALGESKTCTITNDDIAPTLTLVKTVVNDNGGTKVVSDFPLFINANGVTSGVANALSAGVLYTASETSSAGYTASAWGGDCAVNGTITLKPGDAKTCTITNNDNAPSLSLVKVVTNDNGGTALPSAWTLTATGPTGFSGAGPTVGNGPSFDSGTYTLSETGGPAGYTASLWTCVLTGTATPVTVTNAQVAVGLGQDVTCTITNNDNAPSLSLVKVVTNDNGGTALPSAWTLTATGPTGFSGAGPTVGNGPSFDAGTYTLAESGGPAGYTASTWSCVLTGTATVVTVTNAQVAVGLGQDVTCTITNNDNPAHLTLSKTVVNDNGGTTLDTAWTLNAAGPTPISGVKGNAAVTNAVITAGTYTLSETGGPAGYTASTWSCVLTGTATPVTVTNAQVAVAQGQDVTCTITNNDDPAHLTLSKIVINDSGGTALDTAWTLNAAGPTPISGVKGNVAVTNAVITAGTYTLSETGGPAGYTASSWSCVLSGTATVVTVTNAQVAVAQGQDVTCTITNNDDPAHLTLSKIVINDSGGTALDTAWTLNAAGPTPISGMKGNTAVTNVVVAVGTYTLSETGGPAGYTASTWSCVLTGTATAVPVTNAQVAVAQGQDVTCTITNNDDPGGSITIIKDARPNSGAIFSFSGDLGTFTLVDNGGVPATNSKLASGLAAGTYVVTEGISNGWSLTSVTCSDGSATSLTTRTATIVLAAGENVTCTFVNLAITGGVIVTPPPPPTFFSPPSFTGTTTTAPTTTTTTTSPTTPLVSEVQGARTTNTTTTPPLISEVMGVRSLPPTGNGGYLGSKTSSPSGLFGMAIVMIAAVSGLILVRRKA